MLQKYQWTIFWVTCGVVAFTLIVRLVPLVPIYADAHLRARTQKVLQAMAAREGWLVSGVSIRHASRESLQVLYRSYIRGKDGIECYDIDLQSGSLSSCSAS